MARGKRRLLPTIRMLNAIDLIGGSLRSYHDKLASDGFVLAQKAQARCRKDGSWRIRLVWKLREGECATVISRSVILQPDLKEGRIEHPEIHVRLVHRPTRANA